MDKRQPPTKRICKCPNVTAPAAPAGVCEISRRFKGRVKVNVEWTHPECGGLVWTRYDSDKVCEIAE